MAEIEHIGIAVGDLERTLSMLKDVLQVSPYKSEAIEKDRIQTHFLLAGGAKLELLESLSPESPVARFLEKRGPGIHHMAFEVDDIDAVHRRLSQAGYQPLEEAPRAGADGKRIFFLHPRDTAGILIEFCQNAAAILEDAGSAGTLRVRRSAGREGPAVAYLHRPNADPVPDVLARVLEQRFAFRAVEAPAGFDEAAIYGAVGDPHGLIASGDAVPDALRFAVDTDLRVLVLIHPPDRLWPVELRGPILIIGRDRDGLESALEARASISGSTLAVLPNGDSDLLVRLVERHLRKALRVA